MTFWNSIKLRSLSLLIFGVVAIAHSGWTQDSNVSPYSRFGLGDIHDQNHTEQFSMGGLSIPIIDPFALNIANPATYTSLARPVFSVGMRMRLLNVNTSDQTEFTRNHTINNLAVAFPLIRRKLGITAGVMPFSSIGYDIQQSVVSEEFDEQVQFDYSGEGGLTRAFVGGAYQIYGKKDTLDNRTALSVGVNASYIFGSLDRLRKSVYADGSSAFNFRVRDALRVDDFNFNFGVNYTTHLRKMTKDDQSYTKLNLGATFRVPKPLKTSGSLLAETYTLNSSNNIETLVDTVNYIDYDQQQLNMPLALGVGASLDIVTRNFQKVVVGAQYETQLWSDFVSDQDVAGRSFNEMTDSHKFIVGVDFLPDAKISRRILSKVHYRLGVRYEQMNLMVDNEQINAYGISFGAGIPISLKRPQSPSTFNIGVELGQRGTTDNALVQEDYILISFGLTLMPHFRNPWFVQRKYD